MTKTIQTPQDASGAYRTLTLDAADARMNHDILVGDIRHYQEYVDQLKRILAENDALLPSSRCPLFNWQYRCERLIGHAGDHVTHGDDCTEYRW